MFPPCSPDICMRSQTKSRQSLRPSCVLSERRKEEALLASPHPGSSRGREQEILDQDATWALSAYRDAWDRKVDFNDMCQLYVYHEVI